MHRRTLLSALVAVPVLGWTSACGDGPAEAGADGLKTIKLPDSTSYTQLPLRYGEEKGIFKEEGLKVEWVQSTDLIISTGTGDVTFAFGPTTTQLRAADGGAPIKLVAAGFRSKGPFWLIGRAGITKVEDLRAKNVGIASAGSGLETYALKILSAHGLDPKKDVTLVAAGTQETAYGAITTGKVDATIIHQPFAALGELEKKTVTLARGWEYLPTYQTGTLIAGDGVIKNDPELLRAGLKAYFRAYRYAKENYDEYIPWLQGKLATIDKEAVKQAIELEDLIWEGNAAIDLDAVRKSQDIEIEVGHQKKLYDAEKLIDQRFIPNEFKLPFTYPDPKKV
jgi:ABC-type nitrate/sulfonate/bicarbonate transport system substrate-binding protein